MDFLVMIAILLMKVLTVMNNYVYAVIDMIENQ